MTFKKNRIPISRSVLTTEIKKNHGRVYACRTRALTGYPSSAPWNPPEIYPESLGWMNRELDRANFIYRAVRNALRGLEFDSENYGTQNWNPLGVIISPGNRVLIKPNLVRHFHGTDGDLDSVITHVSFIRAIIDYVIIALDGDGEIVIGDAPLQDTDFELLKKNSGLDLLISYFSKYAQVPVEIIDFRQEMCTKDQTGQYVIKRTKLPGDPCGYREVELAESSYLTPIEIDAERFRVTNYNKETMTKSHGIGHHRYLIAGSVLESDVIINLPKLKTHRKAGITACLKNFIGVNGSKDCLPHHRTGSKLKGCGDEYLFPSIRKQILAILTDSIESRGHDHLDTLSQAVKKTSSIFPYNDFYREGSWFGNDTLWRTILDINRIVKYADSSGSMTGSPQRTFLHLVDAVVCGEGEGPMEPTARTEGLVIAGISRAAVDYLCATAAGFDPMKIPTIATAAADPQFNVESGKKIRLKYENLDRGTSTPWSEVELVKDIKPYHPFTPSAGWQGYLS